MDSQGRLVYAAVLWLTLFLAFASAADAAFPGGNGSIAYSAYVGAQQEIFVTAADGSGPPVNVSNSSGNDSGPAWSPDGQRIAFASDRSDSPRSQIWVMNADGSGQTPITNASGAFDFGPAWSPDGEKIVFSRHPDENSNSEVFVVSAAGGAATNMTNSAATADFEPAWSPDGTTIAFVRAASLGPNEIHKMDATSGGGVTSLNADGFTPNWSPDGQKIAFMSGRDNGDGEIYTMNADGSAQTRRTVNPALDQLPSWSPDGTQIAFNSNRAGSGIPQIFTMATDGSNPVQRTTDAINKVDFDWQPIVHPVAITAGPSGRVGETTASFEFITTGEDPPAGGFECRLDGTGGDAWSSCTSPRTVTGLTDGAHRFEVRYKPNAAAAGGAAMRTWTVDTSSPEVLLDEIPPPTGNGPEATIRFHSSKEPASFRCRLDDKAEYDCASPQFLNGLEPGTRRFRITATDELGNVSEAVDFSWVVEGDAPMSTGCPEGTKESVTAGDVTVVAKELEACFVQELVGGEITYRARGLVSMNGLRIRPAAGQSLIVAPTMLGGTVRTTGPWSLVLGPHAIPYPLALNLDSLSVASGERRLAAGEALQGLMGLPVKGGHTVKFSDESGGSTTLGIKLELVNTPFRLLPAAAGSGGGELDAPTIEGELTVSNQDTSAIPALTLKADNLYIGPVQLKNLSVTANFSQGIYGGTLGLTVPGGTLTATAEFGPGGFIGPLRKFGLEASDLDIAIAGAPVPFLFLQKLGGSFAAGSDAAGNRTLELSANAGLSIGPTLKIPPTTGSFFDGAPAELDGIVKLALPLAGGHLSLGLQGEGKVIDIPVGEAKAKYTAPSTVDFSGKLDFSIGGYGFAAGITSATFSPEGWSIDASGQGISQNLGSIESSLWDKGVAACVRLFGMRFGFGKRWGQPASAFGNSCDVAAFRAQLAQAGGARVFSVQPGTRGLVIEARGRGAAPKILVSGPGGRRIVTPAGGAPVAGKDYALFQDAAAQRTYLVLSEPQAGRWSVRAAQGSTLLGVRRADALPPVRVRAEVRGRGLKRTLRWRAQGLGGQRIRFIERGRKTSQILFETGRSRGRRAFRPMTVGPRRRRVDAFVVRNGVPRDTFRVASFRVKLPPLSKVADIRVKDGVLRWRAQQAATSYAVALQPSDGSTDSRVARRARLRLTGVAKGPLTVIIAATDDAGRVGPGGRKRVTVR